MDSGSLRLMLGMVCASISEKGLAVIKSVSSAGLLVEAVGPEPTPSLTKGGRGSGGSSGSPADIDVCQNI